MCSMRSISVFAQPEAYQGLSADEVRTQHETARPGAPGRVEIWPLVLADPKADSDRAWDAPFDEISEKSPVAVLSSRIAHAVKGWIAGRDLSGPCTPVPPGQILVLVRKRDALFEAILRHLKQADVPVAGADRLDIGEHIAVLDLLALADAVLLEDDDLALASVLKSPLFGLDDDDLMRLTDGRQWKPEGRASRKPASRASPTPPAVLADLGHAARRQRPFDFYADILGEGGGRRGFSRPAWARGRRRSRRIPPPRNDLWRDGDRHSVRFRRLDARRACRDQTRPRCRRRRGAGDDGARSEGARGGTCRHGRPRADARTAARPGRLHAA